MSKCRVCQKVLPLHWSNLAICNKCRTGYNNQASDWDVRLYHIDLLSIAEKIKYYTPEGARILLKLRLNTDFGHNDIFIDEVGDLDLHAPIKATQFWYKCEGFSLTLTWCSFHGYLKWELKYD